MARKSTSNCAWWGRRFGQLPVCATPAAHHPGHSSTLYAPERRGQATDLQTLFESFYQGERFVDECCLRVVRLKPAACAPATTCALLCTKPQPDTVMVLVVEDNLTKGAGWPSGSMYEPDV